MHVHVTSGEGEVKFWIEPAVALADHRGISDRELRRLRKIVEERRREIESDWKAHFRS